MQSLLLQICNLSLLKSNEMSQQGVELYLQELSEVALSLSQFLLLTSNENGP